MSASLRVKSKIKGLLKRRLLLHWFPSQTHEYRPADESEAIVLMSLWNRPNRLRDVLAQLDGQQTERRIRLLLWNNTRADQGHYLKTIAEFEPRNALGSVSIVNSPFNLGSMSRFYWARWIARREGAKPVIVLDDDEDIESDFVERAYDSYSPNAFTAYWAFRIIDDDYWQRHFAAPGERVNHIGPGGMIANAQFFLDDGFFKKLPDDYWFLDDIWLSSYAPTMGYVLQKLDVQIEFVMDETNQYRQFVDSKVEFYRELAPMRAVADDRR